VDPQVRDHEAVGLLVKAPGFAREVIVVLVKVFRPVEALQVGDAILDVAGGGGVGERGIDRIEVV